MSAPWHCAASPNYHHLFTNFYDSEWTMQSADCAFCLIIVSREEYSQLVADYRDEQSASKEKLTRDN